MTIDFNRNMTLLWRTWRTNPLWFQPYVPSGAPTIIHIDSSHLFSHETPHSHTHTHTHTHTQIHQLDTCSALWEIPPTVGPGLRITTSSYITRSCPASTRLTFVMWSQWRLWGWFSCERGRWSGTEWPVQGFMGKKDTCSQQMASSYVWSS